MTRLLSTAWLLVLVTPLVAQADVKLPPILSSHMVLQRELPVPIWGTAAPNEKVTVKFRTQEKTATANDKGDWSIKLDPLTAGGPDPLTVSGANSLTLEDVLVGEVWIGSGQSNMAGRVNGYAKGDPGLVNLVEAAPYPQIRLAQATGGWKLADKAGCEGFSAILLPFGVKLNQELKVPVGLMLGAVGGTPSGRWLSEEMYLADALCQEQAKKSLAAYNPEKAKADYDAAVKKWEVATAAFNAEKAEKEAKKEAFAKKAPNKPQPPVEPGKSRGGRFGDLYAQHIEPMVPYAVRGVLWDQGESQTAVEGVDQFAVMGALIKGWRKTWGIEFPFLSVQKPSGGGPAFDSADPVTNRADKFAPLPKDVPAAMATYPMLHLKLREHPQTFLVQAADLGSGIHPTNKSGYGYRSAQVALGGVYGQKVAIYGPTYKSHAVEEGTVRVKFDHVGKGLVQKHGDALQGFALAGSDGSFHWATAKIDGDSVILSSPQVPKPTAVRYSWAHPAPWANFFNADGLPAVPFTTD